MANAAAIHDGVPYCQTCHKREARLAPCGKCGKNVRVLPGKEAVLCKSCRRAGRVCLRCQRPVEYAGRIVAGGVLCPSCANVTGPEENCFYCGENSKYLSRAFKIGLTEPACAKCRRKGNITCPVCRKNREPYGTNSEGKIVCRYCLERDGSPFICTVCGKEGTLHSLTRCTECYGKEYLAGALTKFVSTLSNPFVRELCTGFFADLAAKVGYGKVRIKIKTYLPFFEEVDRNFSSAAEITKGAILERFGTHWLIRWESPLCYMQKTGVLLLGSSEEIQAAMVKERMARLLAKHEGVWTRLLEDYQQTLWEIRDRYRVRGWLGTMSRFRPRTVLALFRAAVAFLESLGDEVRESTQIEQLHLDRFLLKKNGYRTSITKFLWYLKRKRKIFSPLKVEHIPVMFSPHSILPYKRYRELVRGWLDPANTKVKESLLCVLLALYGQHPVRAVSLELSQIEIRESQASRIKLARVWLTLTPEVSALLDRYLVQRQALEFTEGDNRNLYLFPGRKYGQYMGHLTLQEYFDRCEANANQLFGSCIYYAFAHGLEHPRSLVDGFGVTVATAMRYANLFNDRGAMEAAWRIDDCENG